MGAISVLRTAAGIAGIARRKLTGPDSQRGASLVLVAVALPVLLGAGALAVDVGYLYLVRTELQRTADASALAGAGELQQPDGTDPTAARLAAIEYAAANPVANQPVVLQDNPANDPSGDVVIGRIDDLSTPSLTFVPTFSDEANAVKVVTSHDADLFFARLLGVSQSRVRTSAIAVRAAVTGVPVMPLALRGPNFGPIDPKINIKNPGKPGPSLRGSPGEVWETEEFQIGTKVYLAAHGTGRQTGISLVLDMEASGFDQVDEAKILEGVDPPVPVSIGQLYYIFNEGTTGMGTKIEERIEDFPPGDEMRLVVLPVLQTLENLGECCSRNSEGEIVGQLKVVDYVAVHLDGWEEIWVEDLEDGQLRKSLHVIGTVVAMNVEASGVLDATATVPQTSVAKLTLVQ